MKTLSISNPCPANWESMTLNESGRFCGQCQLTVVDFTNMTETEIKNYFQCTYGKKTCGRFKISQLEDSSFRRSSIKSYFLSVLALLALITGCSRKPAYHMMGDVTTIGDTVYIEKTDTSRTTPIEKNPLK